MPEDATWPRYMSVPHPRAVGSYGAEVVEQFRARTGGIMRWWQQLAAARILEHDVDGNLVWPVYLGTISRQGGKSWLMRELALWRMRRGPELWGQEQTIVHTARDLPIVHDIMRPAQAWAQANGLFVRRENSGNVISTGEYQTGSAWKAKSEESAYGQSATAVLVDEGWDVKASTVDEGLEPTLVEQTSPQLGLWSTAHRKATGLMLDRRALALAQLHTPEDVLLLEWSAPESMDLGDERGWRMASPHWSERRHKLVRRAYAKAMAGESVDPTEPDPRASFTAQWLNQWPYARQVGQAVKDHPLADASDWEACLDGDAGPAAGRPVYVAVEQDQGHGAAAAAAALTDDGRVVAGGYNFPTLRAAVDWAQDTAESSADGLLLAGASLVGDPELDGLDLPVDPAGQAEFRDGLPTLRALILGQRLAHDGDGEVTRAVMTTRVRPSTGSSAMLVTTTESMALLRCLVWAAQRAHRDRE